MLFLILSLNTSANDFPPDMKMTLTLHWENIPIPTLQWISKYHHQFCHQHLNMLDLSPIYKNSHLFLPFLLSLNNLLHYSSRKTNELKRDSINGSINKHMHYWKIGQCNKFLLLLTITVYKRTRNTLFGTQRTIPKYNL